MYVLYSLSQYKKRFWILLPSRLDIAFGSLVACGSKSSDLFCIRSSEMGNKSAGFHAKTFSVFKVMVFEVAQHSDYRNFAASGGSHRTVTADIVVTVNHFALLMCGNRNSAADMADNVVAFVIFLSNDFGMADCGFFKIQRMEMRNTVNSLDTGNSCKVTEFIGIGRIDYKCGFAVLNGKLVCNLAAEVCGMLNTVCAAFCMVKKNFTNFINAAVDCKKTAASADKCVNGGKIDSVFLKKSVDSISSVRELVADGGIFFKNGRIMRYVFGKKAFFSFKKSDFGAGGTGIYSKNFIFAHNYLTPCALTQLMATLPTISVTGALLEQSQTIFAKP